jgi:hypothetical protein
VWKGSSLVINHYGLFLNRKYIEGCFLPQKPKRNEALIKERKYEGKYVALSPSEGNKIIASGQNPSEVIEKARKKGVSVPAIVFVPKKDVAYIY